MQRAKQAVLTLEVTGSLSPVVLVIQSSFDFSKEKLVNMPNISDVGMYPCR